MAYPARCLAKIRLEILSVGIYEWIDDTNSVGVGSVEVLMDREKRLLKLVWESEDLGDWVISVAWDPSGSRLTAATASRRIDVLMYRDGVFERLLEMYLDLDEVGGIS